MAIAIDAQSNSGNTSGTTAALTWNHTTAASAKLYVGVSSGRAVSVLSVTYGVASLAQALSINTSGAGSIDVWYTDAPPSGTSSIVVNMNSATFVMGGATSFVNAAASSLGAVTKYIVNPAQASIQGSIVTTVDNSIIFDGLFQNGNAAQTNAATGTGHTRNFFVVNTTDGEGGAGGTTTTTTAGTYTLGYTSSPNEIMALGLVEVKNTAASPAAGTINRGLALMGVGQ